MNYLLNEDEVLHSRFLIFFLSCTNQTKFDSKREKEFNPKKNDKWLSGPSPTKPKKGSKLEEGSKEIDDTRCSMNDHLNSEVQLHQFLEEVHPSLAQGQKLYKK